MQMSIKRRPNVCSFWGNYKSRKGNSFELEGKELQVCLESLDLEMMR